MREDEPAMRLTKPDDTEFLATRDNTSLFTFLGRAALDHVFIKEEETETNTMMGTYIFSSHKMYEKMAEYIFENDYPMYLNLREVAQCDQTAWDDMVHQQVEEYEGIPEGWE